MKEVLIMKKFLYIKKVLMEVREVVKDPLIQIIKQQALKYKRTLKQLDAESTQLKSSNTDLPLRKFTIPPNKKVTLSTLTSAQPCSNLKDFPSRKSINSFPNNNCNTILKLCSSFQFKLSFASASQPVQPKMISLLSLHQI